MLGLSGSASTPVFAPVRAHALRLDQVNGNNWRNQQNTEEEAAAAACLLRSLAQQRQHPLKQLQLFNALLSDDEANLGSAAADVAVICSLETLEIRAAETVPSLLPQLTRVLRHGAVRILTILDLGNFLIRRQQGGLFDRGPAAGEHCGSFCSALSSAPIKHLNLTGICLWDHPHHAAALFGALRGHPTLVELGTSFNPPIQPLEEGESAAAAAGQLIASLVEDDACPALRVLGIGMSGLSSGDLVRVFNALRSNTRLTNLHCVQGHTSITAAATVNDAFVADHVLPAVQACGSLRVLSCWEEDEELTTTGLYSGATTLRRGRLPATEEVRRLIAERARNRGAATAAASAAGGSGADSSSSTSSSRRFF